MMEDTFDIDLVIPYSDDDDNGKSFPVGTMLVPFLWYMVSLSCLLYT